jgi:hypothetical protein
MSTQPDILLDAPAHVQAIETRLDALETALQGSDTRAMDEACGALQRELAEAMAAFHHATSMGIKPLSPELLRRLILAQARVTALQPVVHRAVASIDRTLGVLLITPEDDETYMALGAKASANRLASAYKG